MSKPSQMPDVFWRPTNPKISAARSLMSQMPGMDGIELLEPLLAKRGNLPPDCHHYRTRRGGNGGQRAMKIGAFDFIEKPFEPDALIERVNAAVRWGEANFAQNQKESEAEDFT